MLHSTAGGIEEWFNTVEKEKVLNLRTDNHGMQPQLFATEKIRQELIDNTSKLLNELKDLKNDMNDTKNDITNMKNDMNDIKLKSQSAMNDNSFIKRKLRRIEYRILDSI